MSGLIGRKIGMTSVFDVRGKSVPCTIIQAGPCVVTQIKTKSVDRYDAIQVGFEDVKKGRGLKSMDGHFKKSGVTPKKKLVEFRCPVDSYKLGAVLSVGDLFSEGEYVDVTGLSKGKGFQGVVKRHGFAGVGQATHGQHNRLRAPGSIGASSYPSRVFKGMRMAGRMGFGKVTVQNLVVHKIFPDKNLLVVGGCIPGHKSSYVVVKK